MSNPVNFHQSSLKQSAMTHSGAAADDRGSGGDNVDAASSSTLLSSNGEVGARPFAVHAPDAAFQPPALNRFSRAGSRTPALKRAPAPSTLVSDVLDDPLFRLLPLDDSAGQGSLLRDASLLSNTRLSSDHASATPPCLSRTSVNFTADVSASLPCHPPLPPAQAPSSDPMEISLVLPSTSLPPPTMLLAALADMDVLQRSLYAHTSVWPAREQVGEFKKLVAASMRAELTHGADGNDGKSTRSPHHDHAGATVHASTEEGEGVGEEKNAQTPTSAAAVGGGSAAGARQAHDTAVRAALHSAHGFLHGTETVPTGVPKAHLQRARQTWVRQYRRLHVQPRLEVAQRRRYEEWRWQQDEWSARRGRRAGSLRALRGLSTAVCGVGAAPATICATLKPLYWHGGSADLSTTEGVSEAAVAGKRAALLLDAAKHRYGFLPGATTSSAAAATMKDEHGADLRAAWELDLFDDLQLVVAAQRSHSITDQATSRGAVEAPEILLPSTAGNALTASPHHIPPSNLTQMQLPLPAFVYVMSRYLFLAHYAPHFPAGIFSSALINPFYFPDPAQCTAAYAFRAAPALRREAAVLRAAYAAQLADAHNCFPDRVAYMEIPLPRHDVLHLWELLCPPQQQDRVGRWLPVPWVQLSPEEEDALLEQEYGSPPGDIREGGFFSSEAARVGEEPPLLAFGYARAGRRVYRARLQQLAQHPVLLAEVQRLLSKCEEVAMRFFSTVDTEQRGYILWEDFTTALIEEADIRDHQLKVREHAAQLTRASASVFDRYVVEPLAPALVRLGYTGAVFEVRHSASLVMVEGATDYAVCDGTQLGSVHQRFLVRPVEVVLKELETVPRDAFGRPLRITGLGNGDGDGDDAAGEEKGSSGGYDAALRLHPWRNNQQPVRSFVRYEDGRRLQESTALTVLQQLGGSGDAPDADNDDDDDGHIGAGGGSRAAAESVNRGDDAGRDGASPPARMHQPAKPVALQSVMSVEDVSPYVPWTVFVVLSNDMLLRLYSSNRAVQALPEAGLLRCSETVTCMEWAAGGTHGRVALAQKEPPAFSAGQEESATDTGSATTRPGRGLSRLSVQRQEYIILGTRSGLLCLVDLYAVLHKVPRLTTAPGTASSTSIAGVLSRGDGGSVAPEDGGSNGVTHGGVGSGGVGKSTSERIGSSSSAWSGYRMLAQRTYYNDIDAFVLHRRQVHTPGTLVSSVTAAASNGLFVSSGLDGDVYTMRLGYPADVSGNSLYVVPTREAGRTARHLGNAARAGITTVNSDGTTTSTAERPLLTIEVLQRLTVGETGVRHALPIPSLSMLAVHTVTNKVFLYHTSILPTATALTESGRGEEAVAGKRSENPAPPPSSSQANTSSRLELYDAASPHLGVMVAVMAIEELDQLLTVDSTGYVKVWSLRQSQPLTSFYAIAPVQAVSAYEPVMGQSVSGDGRNSSSSGGTGADSARGAASAAIRPSSSQSTSGGVGDRSSSAGKRAVSALLRTTKHSIEAGVASAESRLQPCLSVAYNYAGKQLYVMGSNNAALCFFMSGQSSARAHTNPLRILLMDTVSKGRGQVHRRLISLSSADCRVWSLVTGAMELGIRASNAEYRQLFDHRITGRPGSASRRGEADRREESGMGGRDRAGKHGRAALSASAPVLPDFASLTAFTSTTGESSRLLPPSVQDVMRAVELRQGAACVRRYNSSSSNSGRQPRVRHLRVNALSTSPASRGASAKARAGYGGTAQIAAGAATNERGPALAATFPMNQIGLGAFTPTESDSSDLLLPASQRDQNVITSDIRCACLGPEGQWVGYALLHGEIRLHRSDSGRLLHTFITTPPSMAELLQAALRYEHLFELAPQPAAAPSGAPLLDHGLATSPRALNSALASKAARPAAAPLKGAGRPPSHAPPKSKLTPAAYAQAVAVTLQRLLTPVKAGQRFGSFSTATRTGAVAAAASSPSSFSAASGVGGVLDGGGRDVHREPLSMFYVEAAQELFVVYADGLVRVFTLLGHRTTATRVIVSRTLVNRALEHVRQVLLGKQAAQPRPPLSPSGASGDGIAKTVYASASSTLNHAQPPLPGQEQQQLPMTGAIPALTTTTTRLRTAEALAGAGDVIVRQLENGNTTTNTNSSSSNIVTALVARSNPAATAASHRRRASSLLASASIAIEEPPGKQRRGGVAAGDGADAATPTVGVHENPLRISSSAAATARPLEADVVLLAAASPPLGLVCLVHASGMVTVMDVHATGEDAGSGQGNRLADGADNFGQSLLESAAAAAAAAGGGAGGSLNGLGTTSDLTRSQAGVVVHSFVTPDEVTAAVFLGAYPCLVLADRQRTLAFHLMKGSSMLATMGDFAVRLQRDLMQRRATLSLVPSGSPMSSGAVPSSSATATATPTLMWTTSIDATCASTHVLGSVTALTFEPLYATLYVGTSQGYIMSYLVRRLLLAFQLTPVFLRGVDGVAVTTYAAELQRGQSRRPTAPQANKSREVSGDHHFTVNTLQLLFHVDPATVRGHLAEGRVQGSDTSEAAPEAAAAPAYGSRGSFLLEFYEAHKEEMLATLGDGSSHDHVAPALSAALARSPSSLLTAAAVLHDAVTRLYVAATLRARDTHETTGAQATPSPWWAASVGGGLVKEYVMRQCGGAEAPSVPREDAVPTSSTAGSDGGDVGCAAVAAAGACEDTSSSLMDTELEMDKEGAQLLREWVASALVAPPTTGEAADTPVPSSAGGGLQGADRVRPGENQSAVSPQADDVDGLEHSSVTSTLPPSPKKPFAPADAVAHSTTAATTSTASTVELQTTGSALLASRPMNSPRPLSPATSPRSIADALVLEVEEELLFGDTAGAIHDHATALNSGARRLTTTNAFEAGSSRPHPITESWVEPLFTRHAIAMASRSPLCLLTPPAMLERSRRERLDQHARGSEGNTAAAKLGEGHGSRLRWEWDHYVEGAPPDYLADMLSRPGQVLPEAERQALRQRAITALQCRRNGYLCVGHADGGVTLWTPYACGRLESLCPSTSLPVSLERLSGSVRMQFQYVHERVVLERQRLAFEGAVRKKSRSEQEGKAQMKQRIRKMLLSHHLSQLSQVGEGAGGKNVGATGTSTQPPMGSLESELLATQPLLCLLLGIASPAELQARQLSLEDLCFLPMRMESIASLEAFKPACYAAAVDIAMQRLQRELMEAGDAAGDEPRGTGATLGQGFGVSSPQRPSRAMSLALGRLRKTSSSRDTRCVYDYPLSLLTHVLQTPFHPRLTPGLSTYPGAVRMLLHRALEGAPLGLTSGRSTRISMAHAPAAHAAEAAAAAAATVDATGPAEGEYFEVCHALQVAEVAAETLFEMGELQRLWTRLQRAEDATTRVRPDAARVSRGKAKAHRIGVDVEDDVSGADVTTQLPPSSAAAVSAAMQRQLQRELEGRLAALSQRAAAGALLRHLRLLFRATGDVSHSRGGALLYARLTRGSGVAWVQATLRQQSRFAFAEPRLRLPAPPIERPPSAKLANAATKLRAAATVRDARHRHQPPLPSSLSATVGEAGLSPIPSTSLSCPLPSPSSPSPLLAPSALPDVRATALCSALLPGARDDSVEAATQQHQRQQRAHWRSSSAAASAPATPLEDTTVVSSSENSVFNRSATVPAVFLTEMNAHVDHDGHDMDEDRSDGVGSVDRVSQHQLNAFSGSSCTPSPSTPAAAAVATSPVSQLPSSPPRPAASSQLFGQTILRQLPLLPRHRTKLARTGSSPPVRPAAAAAAAAVAAAGGGGGGGGDSAGLYSGMRAASLGVPADGGNNRTHLSRGRAPRVKSAHRNASPSVPYTWYSLLGGSGTPR